MTKKVEKLYNLLHFLKKISSYLISFHNTNNQSCHLFAVVISTKPWFLSQEALFFQRIHLAPTSERSTRRRRVSLNVSQHVALNRCRLSYILKTESSVKITKNVWSQKSKTEKKCIFFIFQLLFYVWWWRSKVPAKKKEEKNFQR